MPLAARPVHARPSLFPGLRCPLLTFTLCVVHSSTNPHCMFVRLRIIRAQDKQFPHDHRSIGQFQGKTGKEIDTLLNWSVGGPALLLPCARACVACRCIHTCRHHHLHLATTCVRHRSVHAPARAANAHRRRRIGELMTAGSVAAPNKPPQGEGEEVTPHLFHGTGTARPVAGLGVWRGRPGGGWQQAEGGGATAH